MVLSSVGLFIMMRRLDALHGQKLRPCEMVRIGL